MYNRKSKICNICLKFSSKRLKPFAKRKIRSYNFKFTLRCNLIKNSLRNICFVKYLICNPNSLIWKITLL